MGISLPSLSGMEELVIERFIKHNSILIHDELKIKDASSKKAEDIIFRFIGKKINMIKDDKLDKELICKKVLSRARIYDNIILGLGAKEGQLIYDEIKDEIKKIEKEKNRKRKEENKIKKNIIIATQKKGLLIRTNLNRLFTLGKGELNILR